MVGAWYYMFTTTDDKEYDHWVETLRKHPGAIAGFSLTNCVEKLQWTEESTKGDERPESDKTKNDKNAPTK